MRKIPTTLLVATLAALLASAAALADNTSGTGSDNGNAGTQLVTRYTTLAGSDSNAQALIDGLRNGTQITLGSTTFTPATSSLGYGEINTSLALAQAELAAAGITSPTADQLEAALNGGTVTLSNGNTVNLQGVLDLRASGEGWGQIAKDLGLNLGAVVSASHTDHAQAGMDHGQPGETAAANADHANSMASVDHPTIPDHPSPPDHPTPPTIPDHPDIPSHAGRPGG